MSNSCCFEGIFALLFSSTILISIFLFNANLSMMNIRDYIFINKVKTSNKIKILEILGFESDTYISQSPETFKYISEESENNDVFLDDKKEQNNILELEKEYINNYSKNEISQKITTTKTFEPIKITSQMKKIWIDIENRRKWITPVSLLLITIILISTATSIFINNRNEQLEVVNLYETLSEESNIFIKEIENIILISTDNFYSKYDVSNASAQLQLIESTIMEYERNLNSRVDVDNVSEVNNNLEQIFILINDLDDLISYRILTSEILIYNDIFYNINENIDIDTLSNKLSEITATSRLNYNNLPTIAEFERHFLLLNVTLESAEDLHGRLIASLRNNEYEVANSLIFAINMNKDIEVNEFNKSLLRFKESKTDLFNNLTILP